MPRRGSRPRSRGSAIRQADEGPPAPARHFRGRSREARDDGATRRIVLAGQSVDYRLVRARRRSIGMQIGLSGLTVRAPRWVTIREIDATLSERGAWILRSLAEWRARRRDVLPREWKTGAPILVPGPRTGARRAHRAQAGNRGRPSQPHRASSRRRRRAAGRRIRRPLAARRSPAPAAPAGGRIRGAGQLDAPRRQAVQRPVGMGKLQSEGRDPAQLATGATARRNSRCTSSRTKSRTSSSSTIRHGSGVWSKGCFPGSVAARVALDDWTALLEA